MSGKRENSISQIFSRELITPKEIPKKLKISHKTTLKALTHLNLIKDKCDTRIRVGFISSGKAGPEVGGVERAH